MANIFNDKERQALCGEADGSLDPACLDRIEIKLGEFRGQSTITHLPEAITDRGQTVSSDVNDALAVYAHTQDLPLSTVLGKHHENAMFTSFKNMRMLPGYVRGLQQLTEAEFTDPTSREVFRSFGRGVDLFSERGEFTSDGAIRFLHAIEANGGFDQPFGPFNQRALYDLRDRLVEIARLDQENLAPSGPFDGLTLPRGAGGRSAAGERLVGETEVASSGLDPMTLGYSPAIAQQITVVREVGGEERDIVTIAASPNNPALQAVFGDMNTPHPAVTSDLRALEGRIPRDENQALNYYFAVRDALPEENVVLVSNAGEFGEGLVMIENEDGQLQPVNPPETGWFGKNLGMGHIDAAVDYGRAGMAQVETWAGDESARMERDTHLENANRQMGEATRDLRYRDPDRLAALGVGALAVGAAVIGAPIWAATTGGVLGAMAVGWGINRWQTHRGKDQGLHDGDTSIIPNDATDWWNMAYYAFDSTVVMAPLRTAGWAIKGVIKYPKTAAAAVAGGAAYAWEASSNGVSNLYNSMTSWWSGED